MTGSPAPQCVRQNQMSLSVLGSKVSKENTGHCSLCRGAHEADELDAPAVGRELCNYAPCAECPTAHVAVGGEAWARAADRIPGGRSGGDALFLCKQPPFTCNLRVFVHGVSS